MKKAQGEAIIADKALQTTILIIEKQLTVITEKFAGLAEQIKDLNLQIAELKKKAEGQGAKSLDDAFIIVDGCKIFQKDLDLAERLREQEKKRKGESK